MKIELINLRELVQNYNFLTLFLIIVRSFWKIQIGYNFRYNIPILMIFEPIESSQRDLPIGSKIIKIGSKIIKIGLVNGKL